MTVGLGRVSFRVDLDKLGLICLSNYFNIFLDG